MHEPLTPAATCELLAAVSQHIVDSVDLLTTVDQAMGDGDHGIGMRRGFAAVVEQAPTHAAIRRTLLERTMHSAPILFGGSVNVDNAFARGGHCGR